ncbi:MAG TPA: hypothetical protein PK466_00030 [Thermotogota bacterium]|nr:hypothetical protein [Thermotogota bacterium]HPR94685.1 hypothetical protein [Thermotogota bacterium]
MVVKKRKRILTVFLILFSLFSYLNADTGISPDLVSDYDSIYLLQKNIYSLEEALHSCLSTLLYSNEQFESEEKADELLKRIYKKIELRTRIQEGDRIFTAIISESTDDLLQELAKLDNATSTYAEAYPLMEFVINDFINEIERYRFEDFKKFLEICKLQDFDLIEKIPGDQLKQLTNHLIETIKTDKLYFSNEFYTQLVLFGGEKLINYLSIQITPYIDTDDDESYKEQLSLLNSYVNIYRIYYKSDFEDKIPEQNYNYYLYLSHYFDYLENVEILSKRFITAEATTLSALSEPFNNYLNTYNDIQIKTETLNEKVEEMIKNASTRLVYANPAIKQNYEKIKTISLNNQQLQGTLNNFNVNLLVESTVMENSSEKSNLFDRISDYLKELKINIFILIGLLILTLTMIYLFLPLKIKGILLKNIGMNAKALTILQKASIQKPMDADIHIKTAQIYEKMGRDEDAINEYKIASKVIDLKGD